MSDIRDFCPLWGEWEVVEKLGEGSFGTVWKIRRNVVGGREYYAAVKHVSIPRDDSEIKQLIGEGVVTDEDSAIRYYSHVLQSFVDEIDAMHKLRGFSNIVSYEDHKIIPKAGGIGYDLFLRMELLTPLTDRIQQGMGTDDVVSLGIDIATAISILYKFHMIHRDIKPQNIFVNNLGIYKLGDYGTARALGTVATAMSRKGTYNYMSPEIYSNRKADIRADIYSLGIVLYRLLNGNRLPFLPVDRKLITSEDSEQALVRRISGGKLPAPKDADAELSRIVLKACEFNPENRYKTPDEMIRDLEKYQNKDQRSQGAYHPKRTMETNRRKTNEAEKRRKITGIEKALEAAKRSIISEGLTIKISEQKDEEVKSNNRGKKNLPIIPKVKKKWLIPIIAVLLIGLIGGALWRAKHLGSKYTITWQDEDGRIIDTVSAIYGTTPRHTDLKKEADQQYNYIFTGWTPDIGTVTSDAAYRATFRKEARSYTITWQDESGKTIDTTIVEYGKKPTHEDITKESDEQYTYTFSGWEPEIKNVTGDATYRSSFLKEVRSYTISWQNDTGETFDTTTVKYGERPTYVSIPTKRADEQYTYSFSGWEPEIRAVTGDATYKAAFIGETRIYKIIWQDDTGKVIDTTTAEYGSKPAHTEITKESDEQYSYIFSGWKPEIKVITGDATLTASFRKKLRSYTITWQDDEGKTIDI